MSNTVETICMLLNVLIQWIHIYNWLAICLSIFIGGLSLATILIYLCVAEYTVNVQVSHMFTLILPRQVLAWVLHRQNYAHFNTPTAKWLSEQWFHFVTRGVAKPPLLRHKQDRQTTIFEYCCTYICTFSQFTAYFYKHWLFTVCLSNSSR